MSGNTKWFFLRYVLRRFCYCVFTEFCFLPNHVLQQTCCQPDARSSTHSPACPSTSHEVLSNWQVYLRDPRQVSRLLSLVLSNWRLTIRALLGMWRALPSNWHACSHTPLHIPIDTVHSTIKLTGLSVRASLGVVVIVAIAVKLTADNACFAGSVGSPAVKLTRVLPHTSPHALRCRTKHCQIDRFLYVVIYRFYGCCR